MQYWMATLIDYILISLDLKTIVQAHGLCIDVIPSDPDVSKCNQSRWHHMRNSSIAVSMCMSVCTCVVCVCI